jgi:uncharacterized membrane protein YidH (DUF202 family)
VKAAHRATLGAILMVIGIALVWVGFRHFNDGLVTVVYHGFHYPERRQFPLIAVGIALVGWGATYFAKG